MNDHRWLRSAARSIVFLLQLGLSMLMPPVVCLLGAWYLQERLGWGGWVWAVAIILGLVMGASSFADFARLMQREADHAPRTDWDAADTPPTRPPADAPAPPKAKTDASAQEELP